MSVMSSFIALQRLRASLGETPQGVNAQIAQLLEQTLQSFHQDFAHAPVQGENIIPLEAWKKNLHMQAQPKQAQEAQIIPVHFQAHKIRLAAV
jgi:hypothetical protein